MARKLQFDKLLFLATFLLLGVSVVMVYSASAMMAMERYQQPNLFLIKQGMWAVLGIASLPLVLRIDYHSYRNSTFLRVLLGAVGVALGLVLLSTPVNGARRWFNVGGIGVQPSELAKLCAIFCIAALLERRRHRINEVSYSLLPIGAIVGGFVLLILLEPDLGTALSIVAIAAVMVFTAGLRVQYVAIAVAMSAPLIYWALVGSEYRRLRLLAFWDPWAYPLREGFQSIQSFIAVGTGGLFGRGLMEGVQKLFYLPEPHTDFIYAVIGEEFGLLGTTAILACFGLIIWRGLRVAVRAPDSFGAFLAIGLTVMIGVQAFVNMSVVLGLLPTTGLPLPFVSNGGSSLLVNVVGMGVLLNVSQHGRAEA